MKPPIWMITVKDKTTDMVYLIFCFRAENRDARNTLMTILETQKDIIPLHEIYFSANEM